MNKVYVSYSGSGLDKVKAIKGIRRLTGWDLKDSKSVMEDMVEAVKHRPVGASLPFTLPAKEGITDHEVDEGIKLLGDGGFLFDLIMPIECSDDDPTFVPRGHDAPDLLERVKGIVKDSVDAGEFDLAIDLLCVLKQRKD